MADLTLDDFERWKDSLGLDQALQEEGRNMFGLDYQKGRPRRKATKSAVGSSSSIRNRLKRLNWFRASRHANS